MVQLLWPVMMLNHHAHIDGWYRISLPTAVHVLYYAGAAGLVPWNSKLPDLHYFFAAASLRYTMPLFITNSTRRAAVMSRLGSPSTAMMSACIPGASTPI